MSVKYNNRFKIYQYSKIVFFLLIFLLITFEYSPADSSLKYSDQNIPFKKYLVNYELTNYNQLWANNTILQDKQGIIYSGNLYPTSLSGNLYQFDGALWRIIPGPQSGIKSMAIDDKGTIYIGGYNEIGFFTPTSHGKLKYKSLLEQLNKEKNIFNYVFSTHLTKEGIYFQCLNYLFRWNPTQEKFKEWIAEPGEEFISAFKCKGKYFVSQSNKGLLQLENDHLNLIPGSEIFKDKQISMMVSYNSQNILIGTKYNGLYLFDGSTFRTFSSELNIFLRKNKINHGIRLSSGEFALGTAYGGLAIIDSQGKKKEIFNKPYGLQDNEIYYVFEDIEGNIWVALESGISRIEYISPISINNDLPLYYFSIIKHRGVLYIGTDNGLYYLSPKGKFLHVPETSNHYSSLLSIENSIIAATDYGVSQLKEKGNNMHSIIDGNIFYGLLQSKKDKKRIWVIGLKGLFSIYKQKNEWKKEFHFEKITQPIYSIAEEKNGNLWLGLNFLNKPSKEIVMKVEFPENGTISSPTVTGYRITSQPLSQYACCVYNIAGHITFTTEKGLFHFDEKTNTFIPDLTLGIEYAGGTKTKDPLLLLEDKNKNIWFHSKNWLRYAKFKQKGSYEIRSKPFKRIKEYYWYPIYPDPVENITWIGGKGKLIRYDHSVKKNHEINFSTLVRRVLANGKPIFEGNQIDNLKEFHSEKPITTIPYKDRNLHFEFAAPFFQDECNTLYRYMLEGYDDKWSDWGWEIQKEYNSLAPGTYIFRTQSKNVYQHLGKEAVFKFKVLVPWYWTWWSFLIHAFLFLVVTYLIIKWRRSFQLEKEKQKLEQTVNERTKEIEEKSEKLKEMDKVKSRFFANISHEFRTPLTLIMGPLEQILPQQKNKNHEKKIQIALQNSQRLLGLINQLLDLSKLDSGKMKLQVTHQNMIPFLKGIISTFEPILEKKMLDLTMNFQKEDINLYFDPEKLEHVILNLLGNAVKFTPAGGKIMISVAEKMETKTTFPLGSVDIIVRDTGPGIPRDELTHIFDHFYQSNIPDEKHPIGSGIGLAIAKELIELHHGEILTQSRIGEGTEFVIRLPLGDSHLIAGEIGPILKKPYQYQFKSDDEFSTHFNPEKDQHLQYSLNDHQTIEKFESEITDADEFIECEDDPSLEAKKNIILVVEDNKDLRHYIKESLEPLYEVQEAKNGHEGIQKAQEVIPDLIISDVMMPGVDGYQLCRQIKNHIKTSHIPIILLTAKASEENIIEGLETGADDYITKPFNTKILCARIKNLIDLRYQLQLKRKRQITMQPEELLVSSMDEEFYQELQEVIEKNLSDFEFNVDQLAKKLYMSRTSLYRKILALTGTPPRQFIRTYRLKRAAQLLKSNFGNVTEVAVEVGFNNMAYFTKCFKDEFHQLPSAYQSSEAQS